MNNQDNGSESSLPGLNAELDNIYSTYTNSNNNGSVDTLDSNSDQAPGRSQRVFRTTRLIPNHKRLPEVHISSRLSSLNLLEDRDITQSAPQSPNSSSSFDFNPRDHHAVTNSSLNVLLDTPTTEAEFRNLVDSTPTPTAEGLEGLQVPASDVEPSVVQGENENWDEKGAAVRKVEDKKAKFRLIKRGVQDFEFGKSLGEGSYSTVVLATDKHTSQKYAVKILDKRHIIKEKKVKYVNIEKHALNRLSNRVGIISLYFTFQDKASLYFVLDYASNGELLTLIKKYNTLNEDCVRHFSAQILDAIKYMHDNGVIHRDIKPENILLDDKLRIQITDFGTARLLEKKNDESEDYPVDVRAKSFVGTAEYVSPELLESKYCGKPGDIWAFGCIVYQMIAGKPPFKATNEYLTFQKITKLQYAFSAGFPMVVRDLIKKILVLQPSKRITIPQIQRHFFFQSVQWNNPDSIWNTAPPELGPYKMNAKSMMKVPELAESSQGSRNNKKVSNGGSANRVNGKPVNPASVAAFVLNKKENSSDTDIADLETNTDNGVDESVPVTKVESRSSSSAGGSSRTPSTADYIPGTNILRPTFNTRASFSRAPTSQKKQPRKKSKPEIMQPTPISSLEVAWASYLIHPDERIMKIGPVIFSKQSTESFERKYKGILHNAPLDYATKLQATRSRGSSSFLSQVVHGPSKGLRGSVTSLEGDTVDEDESKAITTHRDIEELANPTIPRTSTDSSNNPTNSASGKQSKSSKLKKFLLPGNKNNDGTDSSSGNGSNAAKQTLEKGITCTMMVTTHGRVLIFYRNDIDSEYVLINEIKLNHPFIQFKEVVSTSTSKFQKGVPTTGIFGIESSITTFVFEIEKYDINQWTESLAKAKLNQFERENAGIDKEPIKTEPVRPKPKSPPGRSSPKLVESPVFTRATKKALSPPVKQTAIERAVSPASTESKTRHKENMLAHRLKGKSVKRKPPPPINTHHNSINHSTGLASPTEEYQDGGLLHAAQLAVSNNASHKPSESQRTSFTKETQNKYVILPSSPVQSSSNAAGKNITSMNSKFLARSQRKK
mmetsp:Transcript_6085/g.7465  ORF Transcript_6085/g.7465 Transcript_6085/m.7465 type:complete len:1063 (+) Transcript_6085:341-3529(+)